MNRTGVPLTRSAAEIGRGLAPARAPRPIVRGERIHVVGAAGAGASAAALLAHHAGASVSGCDPGGPSPYSPQLAAAGIVIDWRHDPAHVRDALGGPPLVDRVCVTKALTSIAPDHPELEAARRSGVPVEAWQQAIADAASTQGGRLVALAGTHGKSTSTGWLVHLLASAGVDPAAFVGAAMDPELTGGLPATARWGKGDAFVVEADEYAGNFDAYRPEIAVLLNIEWDHPDVFADEDAVIETFRGWLRRPTRNGAGRRTLVANVGSPGVVRLLEGLADWDGRIVRVRLAQNDEGAEESGPGAAQIAGRLLESPDRSATLVIRGLKPGTTVSASLPLAGRHNAENALAVAAAAHELGVSGPAIRVGLETFPGVGRRMELKGEIGGVVVVDDYAHHPTAIAATIAAVRSRYPGRRLWAVYEPLTYHRTAALLDGFSRVLATADRVLIADIWAGRDPDTTITSASALATAVASSGLPSAAASGPVEQTADILAAEVEPGDIVLVMGGGRSYVIADRLVHLLRLRTGGRTGAG